MAEASSGGAGENPVSSRVEGKQERAGRGDLEPARQHGREEKGQVTRGESTSRSDHGKNQGRQGGGKGRRNWYSHKPYRQWDYSGQQSRSSRDDNRTADEREVQKSKVDGRYTSDPSAKQKESSERSRGRRSGYPGGRERLEVEGRLGSGDVTEKGRSSERDHRQQRYRRGKERSPQPRRKVKQDVSSEELRKVKSESSIDQSNERSEPKGTQLHVASVERDKGKTPISKETVTSEAPEETGNRDRRMDESVGDNHGHRSNDSRTSRSGRRPRHYDQYTARPHYGGVDERRYYNQEGGRPARKHERGRERSYKDEEKGRLNQNVTSQSTSVFHETRAEASSVVQPPQQYPAHDSAEHSREQSSTGTSRSDSRVSKSKSDIGLEQRHRQETDPSSNSDDRGPNRPTQPGDSRGGGGRDGAAGDSRRGDGDGGGGAALLPPKNHNYTTSSVSHTRHQKQQQNAKPRPRPPNPKSRSRKVVPTVQSDELAQELTAGTYECMVCCDRVRSRDQVWACGNCYHVFHLKCIGKWAISPAAALDEGV